MDPALTQCHTFQENAPSVATGTRRTAVSQCIFLADTTTLPIMVRNAITHSLHPSCVSQAIYYRSHLSLTFSCLGGIFLQSGWRATRALLLRQ